MTLASTPAAMPGFPRPRAVLRLSDEADVPEGAVAFLHHHTGIPLDRLGALANRASVEFEELGVLKWVPPSLLSAACRRRLHDEFQLTVTVTLASLPVMPIAAEPALADDPGFLASYKRIRAKWIFAHGSLLPNGLRYELLNRIRCAAERYAWTQTRAAATGLFVLVADDAVLSSFSKLCSERVLSLTPAAWLEYFKLFHVHVKSRKLHPITGEFLKQSEVAQHLYWHELVGRGSFMTPEAVKLESAKRHRVPEAYGPPLMSAAEFHAQACSYLEAGLRMSGTPGAPESWQEFTSSLWARLAGGFCNESLPPMSAITRDTAIKRCRLSGRKRAVAEFMDLTTYPELEEFVSRAFSKFEVGKERFIYPASFVWNLVGQHAVSGIEPLFTKLAGIDLGHSAVTAVQVKEYMMVKCAGGLASLNCDGVGFNENHSAEDLSIVTEVAKVFATENGLDHPGVPELMRSLTEYESTFRNRKVVVGGETIPIVGNLLSGEYLTQITNSSLMWCLLRIATRLLVGFGALGVVEIFCKGDDANALCQHWLTACALAHALNGLGMKSNYLKDECQVGAVEHERCMVDGSGYYACIARKCGNCVTAEPQGSPNLVLAEYASTLAALLGDFAALGVPSERLSLVEQAFVSTVLGQVDTRQFSHAMWGPGDAGGFDQWCSGPHMNRNPTKVVSLSLPTWFSGTEGLHSRGMSAHAISSVLSEAGMDVMAGAAERAIRLAVNTTLNAALEGEPLAAARLKCDDSYRRFWGKRLYKVTWPQHRPLVRCDEKALLRMVYAIATGLIPLLGEASAELDAAKSARGAPNWETLEILIAPEAIGFWKQRVISGSWGREDREARAALGDVPSEGLLAFSESLETSSWRREDWRLSSERRAIVASAVRRWLVLELSASWENWTSIPYGVRRAEICRLRGVCCDVFAGTPWYRLQEKMK